MFIQCSLIRDTNFRSLSIIEQTSALLGKLSLDINLKVRFLITAAQLGSRCTINISLALQYVGKWCIILNALLYATYSLCKLSRRYTDFARATITQDIFIPGPIRPGLSTVSESLMYLVVTTLPTSQSELALPSTGSWLPSRLSST